jgi:hypothetical protein
MEEKELYQIADRYSQGAFYIEWNKLPDEVLDRISRDYLYTLTHYSVETGTLETFTVAYFRKVKKFRKGVTEFEQDNIIYGV